MSRRNFKLKICEKNPINSNTIIPAFETNAVTQQVIVDKKAGFSVPDMASIKDAKKFSEENQQ
ncbi:MAG: hypothetical protein RSD67_07960 [Oscillospiraceae bacterium]